MGKTTLAALEELLQGAQEGVDDSETVYKIRSARQLVEVLKQRQDDLDDAIDEAVSDETIVENLRDLGYLD